MNLFEALRSAWSTTEETWPPPEVKDHWFEIQGYRMRYRNDRAELIRNDPNLSTDQHKVETYVPVPWPRELCRFSASLLFSETPQVSLDGDPDDLNELFRVNDFGGFCVRGGVQAACDGRIGIRVIYDPDISETPLMTLVPEDQIVWDKRHGAFYAGGMVVIESRPQTKDKDKDTYRLLEEHTKGLVTRHLYKGTRSELGKEVPLSACPEFADYEPEWETGIDTPTLIPWENVPGGESDLFGLGPIFNALNEAETLLLDRGRKSVPRVFVDKSLVDATGRTQIDGFIVTGGSRMRPVMGSTTNDLINTVDVKLQYQEHVEWINHLTQLMVETAGYAPATWGIQGETASVQRAVSGYAMKLAQLRTLLSRSQKEHMAMQALGVSTAVAMALIRGEEKVTTLLPTIALGDGLPSDPLDGAQEVLYLAQAGAASTQTKVEIVHPTWSPEEIQTEIDAITDEAQFPPGTGPGQGIGPIGSNVRQIVTAAKNGKAGGGIDPTEGVE
jgi:hypothetical protein